MKLANTFCCILAGAALLASPRLHADTVSISILGGRISGSTTASPVGANALFQLVNLGSNGVFDPIEQGAWTSGDDRLVKSSFASGASNLDGWLTAGAFDLSDGAGTIGELNRFLTLVLDGVDLKAGDKLGVRWFPSIAASNSYESAPPLAGISYGQFTRLDAPLHGGSLWIVPTAGQAVMFDPLLTSLYTGTNPDPDSASLASFSVLIPEPGTAALLLAAAPVAFLRRRKSAA